MALLFFDGFDHAGTAFASFITKWGGNNGGGLAAGGRTGTGCVSFTGASNYVETKVLPAVGGIVIGVARNNSPNMVDASNFFEIREGGTLHLAVGVTGGGLLQVKRGATVLATGTSVLMNNVWYYLELKATIHDTTGSYELRLDGLLELSASGIDTRNGGTTGQWDRIRLTHTSSLGFSYADDLYVCDTSGPAPLNDFLGPCKVETLLPQTGNGSNIGLTPSTGTDHGALVDENPPNTTDFNSSATVGAKDTYNYPSLALPGGILGIQTNLYVSKSDAAARQVCAVVRSGGTDYDGATVAPASSFAYFWEVRALNPATGLAWTAADVAALEVGMKVTA